MSGTIRMLIGRAGAAGLLLCAAALLTGCGTGYVLKGRAIEGSYTDIEVVPADDDRLRQPGIEGVMIRLHRDAGRMNQQLVATGRSGADGSFAIPVDAFGAGWMDEQWLIEVERAGYRSGEMIMHLPGASRRVVVTMTEGTSVPHKDQEDLWEQYERYK